MTDKGYMVCSYCGQAYPIGGTHWCPNSYGSNPHWQTEQELLNFMTETRSILLQIVEKLDAIEKNSRRTRMRIIPNKE